MRRKFSPRRMGCLLLLVILPLLMAWQPRAPVLHGIAKRPFPAIFPIDYPLCRAEAYLSALGMARKRLPPSLNTVLRHLGAPVGLSRLAAAALLFPVDVVTPEKVNGNVIRVFLKDDQAAENEALLEGGNSLRLLLEICLIWETAAAVEALRAEWPKSVEQGRREMTRLDDLGHFLRQVWLALQLNGQMQRDGWSNGAWLETVGSNDRSGGILLACVLENPTGNLARATQAVNIFLEREANARDREEAALWNRLAAYSIHLRGIGHERMGQTALAEADYDAALARLQKAGINDGLTAAILEDRAELRRHDGKLADMCADFAAACGIGYCTGLADARRQGLCLREEAGQ